MSIKKWSGPVLAYDVETSGLNDELCGLTQISGIIYLDGVEVERFNFDVRPFEGAEVQKKALEVTGKTYDEVMDYPDESEVFVKFIGVLKKYIDPMVYESSYTPIAYNGGFDAGFLQAWFDRQGKKYSNYVNYRLVDMLVFLRILHLEGLTNLKSYKLSTVYEAIFGEAFDAHNSAADVEAMMKIHRYLVENYIKDPR